MTKHAGSFWVVPAVYAESRLSSLAPPSELSQQLKVQRTDMRVNGAHAWHTDRGPEALPGYIKTHSPN